MSPLRLETPCLMYGVCFPRELTQQKSLQFLARCLHIHIMTAGVGDPRSRERGWNGTTDPRNGGRQ